MMTTLIVLALLPLVGVLLAKLAVGWLLRAPESQRFGADTDVLRQIDKFRNRTTAERVKLLNQIKEHLLL
ncbi:hypothetical protein CSQ96_04335 [Janthinobacterium sp. BJB412]|nr:hypothetical protein CSQ96_04335 [Janthinobacterium sp. BJB412]